MVVLGFDTASAEIGVGLWIDGQITMRCDRVGRGAETKLVPWAMELLAEAGCAVGDVQGVALARGPGAFTGLRVGMATALGLAVGLDVPVMPFSSLETRAALGGQRQTLVMLDARKGRVYAQWFSGGVPDGDAVDLHPSEVLTRSEAFVAVGEGALVYKELVEEAGGSVSSRAGECSVGALVEMGAAQLLAGTHSDASQVQPVYLRRPDARTIAERDAAAKARG